MSWASVQGHERIVEAFRKVRDRGRLAHAYLFVGPPGIGKRLFAVELARALLCEASGAAAAFDACDRCPACLQITARTHPDFLLAGLPEERQEFPIELMQEVIRSLAMKPARGRHRVAILDDADLLNEEAANCFLKTLEEPPPASVLILISTSADRQLPTIRSRCQVVRFAPLPSAMVAAHLIRKGLATDQGQALQVAQLAGGSLARARLCLDPDFARLRRELLDGLARIPVPSAELAARFVENVEDAAKEAAGRRERAGLILESIIGLLQLALLLRVGRTTDFADQADLKSARQIAQRVDEDRLTRILDRCLDASQQITRRLQLVLILEALMDALGQGLQVGQPGQGN